MDFLRSTAEAKLRASIISNLGTVILFPSHVISAFPWKSTHFVPQGCHFSQTMICMDLLFLFEFGGVDRETFSALLGGVLCSRDNPFPQERVSELWMQVWES